MTEDLVLVEQFLNTLDERTFTRHGQKRVGGDALTTEWLEAHGLGSDLAAATSLRNALRHAITDGTQASAALADFPLRLAPGPDGRLRLTAASGSPGLDAIVETVATSVAGGGWDRMKLCSAGDCRWAFYDTSRNNGGRWCSMDVCGNRSKTRAYRRRQAD